MSDGRFGAGAKNGHTVYWRPDDPREPDRFVCVAMSTRAATELAATLNRLGGVGAHRDLIAAAPPVARKES